MTSEQMGWPGLSEHGRRLGRRPSATRTIICAILCLANQVNQLANVQADQQQQQHQAARAAFATSRYELKFQNELDNSTVIKHLAQQQVFKCQVRLAPHGQTTIAAQSAGASSNHQVRRLKSSSSWLSSEAAERKYLKALQELHNDQLSRMLLTSADTAGSEQQQQQQHRHKYKQLVNITHLSIDWLKDGQSVWGAFPSEPVSIVNVTLRAQRTLDKVARPMKSRVEIKNTLNGQQMKLTSRLRLSHLRPTDSGQYKCVARVSFLQRPIEQQHQLAASSGDSGTGGELIEYIEQSLESVGAHLIVMALNSNHTNDNGEATTINFQQQNGGSLQANGKGPTGASSQALPPTTATGHDNEVRRRKAESSRPQIYPDDTQDTDDSLPGPNERSQSANGAGSQMTTGPQSNPLFEDDEDLFRLDLTELINGQQQQQLATNDNINSQDQQVVGGVGTGGANSSETMDSHANDLLVNSQQIARERQHEAYLDWILDNGDDPASLRSSASDDASLGGSLSALFSGVFHQQSAAANRFGDKKIDDPGSSLANADVSNSSAPAHRDHGQHSRADELVGRSSAAAAGASPPLDHRRGDDHALSPIPSSSSAPLFVSQLRPISPPPSPADPRSKLARFVHKIVPEPSCYTGLGEHYRGNASISSDQRPCLNWLQVRVALSRTAQSRPTTTAMANSGQNRTPQAAAAWGTPLAPIQQPGLARGRTDDHNHCRNPNNDQRGPWCFVSYSEELDGALVKRPYLSANSQQWKTATSKQRTVRVDPESGQLFVVAPCQLASCSEYLWLYVVAPPLGLLVLLTCLLSLFIRSIRKSHYNAIFSAAYQRHNDPSAKSTGLLCKFMQSRKRLVIDGSELVASSKRNGWACCGIGSLLKKSLPFASPASPRKKRQAGSSRGTYLDEDMFEVVDDIDWSDGQPTSTTSQSMSPSESFRLHSTATTCDEHHHSIKSPTGECRQNCNWSHMSNLTHSKSINPMCGGNQVAALDLPMGNQTRQQQSAVMSSNTPKMSKSRSQVGPMFATLRCHVRNTHNQQQQQRQPNGTRGIQNCPQLARKSSSFIENGQLDPCQQQLASAEKQETTCDRASNLSSLRTTATTIDDHSIAASGKTTGLLLSCGSSSGASSGSGGSNSALVAGSSSSSTAATLANRNNNINKIGASENYTLASELTRLDASSVTLAYDMQAIYEGKFSQVQMAYLKQRKDDLAQATGRIGAQVAVCSLKEQAALDESVFYATNLRVRNLNHLNILKLLGYVQLDNDNYNLEDSSMNNSSIVRANAKCSLVYDMAHMIDLNDWLKEQCKDTFDARNNNSDLCLRQNLTCLAKQIALALDYLHDKNIVYKDLACRNCFLDVTRMLVKLASFNIEPEFEVGDDVGGRNSESGGRDRYYNVGDSDADLISKKLSLKSMVRPKYLLDYYVIDSRPAECQLLPLSWISLESILFNKFNKNTDIWSFGCLLYELFSLGEVAYFGYSSKQVIDSVRSNLMPPQPLLCPNGIYKLMCKCLSDIPTLRPNIKHVYEQLNLYSGQCSSFLNHHLCII